MEEGNPLPAEATKPISTYKRILRSPVFIFTFEVFAVVAFFLFGCLVYFFANDQFSSVKTNTFTDGMYFITVTLLTIGYGDIFPKTTLMKVFTCFYVLIGTVFVKLLLLDIVERIFKVSPLGKIVKKEIDGIKVSLKLVLSIVFALISIAVGVIFISIKEHSSIGNSIYFSIISMTTVGYGDFSFKSYLGRIFGFFWLFFSTNALGMVMATMEAGWRRWRIKSIWQSDVKDYVNNAVQEMKPISMENFLKRRLEEMRLVDEVFLNEMNQRLITASAAHGRVVV